MEVRINQSWSGKATEDPKKKKQKQKQNRNRHGIVFGRAKDTSAKRERERERRKKCGKISEKCDLDNIKVRLLREEIETSERGRYLETN